MNQSSYSTIFFNWLNRQINNHNIVLSEHYHLSNSKPRQHCYNIQIWLKWIMAVHEQPQTNYRTPECSLPTYFYINLFCYYLKFLYWKPWMGRQGQKVGDVLCEDGQCVQNQDRFKNVYCFSHAGAHSSMSFMACGNNYVCYLVPALKLGR